MKPYETGICVCGKKKEEHLKISSKYSDLFYCYDIGEGDFLDSGTVHLCSEEVASGLLRELQKARELINKQHCTGKVSANKLDGSLGISSLS